MTKDYFKQLRLPITKRYVDSVSDLLVKCGALSITLEEDESKPIYQSANEHMPLWPSMYLIALFPSSINPSSVMEQVHKSYGNKLGNAEEWVDVVDEDWVNKWKQDFRPMCFGGKLWVCPSWCEVPEPSGINIILDPEMAFGTGNHQTTGLCLEWLTLNPPHNLSVIDYGCGSGILAIAAAKLGANEVFAVDIDETALEVCRTNATKNNVTLNIYNNVEFPIVQADLLVANILAQPLLELSSLFVNMLKPGSTIVLSGILTSQIDLIVERYSTWCEDFVINTRDEWAQIVAKKEA